MEIKNINLELVLPSYLHEKIAYQNKSNTEIYKDVNKKIEFEKNSGSKIHEIDQSVESIIIEQLDFSENILYVDEINIDNDQNIDNQNQNSHQDTSGDPNDKQQDSQGQSEGELKKVDKEELYEMGMNVSAELNTMSGVGYFGAPWITVSLEKQLNSRDVKRNKNKKNKYIKYKCKNNIKLFKNNKIKITIIIALIISIYICYVLNIDFYLYIKN